MSDVQHVCWCVTQTGAYGDPGRDPRGWTVTVAYAAVVDHTELGVKAAVSVWACCCGNDPAVHVMHHNHLWLSISEGNFHGCTYLRSAVCLGAGAAVSCLTCATQQDVVELMRGQCCMYVNRFMLISSCKDPISLKFHVNIYDHHVLLDVSSSYNGRKHVPGCLAVMTVVTG